jgi:hypothetical protein
VLIPTRGRPGNAARLATAFRDTHALDAVAVFVADHDDPELPQYRTLLEDGLLDRLMILDPGHSTGRGMCGALNYAARRYAELYDYVGFMGDDHLPRTPHWDSRILEELDSLEPRVVYGNDLLQGAALPTAAFMHSRMVRAMGFMAPACLRHLYADNFWMTLGQAVDGLRYLPDVVIEHIHPAAGKADMDERYRVVNSAETDQSDRREWTLYQTDGRMDGVIRHIRREYGL